MSSTNVPPGGPSRGNRNNPGNTVGYSSGPEGGATLQLEAGVRDKLDHLVPDTPTSELLPGHGKGRLPGRGVEVGWRKSVFDNTPSGRGLRRGPGGYNFL